MIKGSDFIGLPVFKDHKIETNYYVIGLVISKYPFKLLALYVKSRMESTKIKKVIPYKKIESITSKKVIISSENDIIFPNQITEIEEAHKEAIKIFGFHIYNHEGELVGIIKDIIIQKNTGKVVAFIISEGVYDDLVQGYSLLPIINFVKIQDDNIIIGENELNSILNQGGGLKKILGIE